MKKYIIGIIITLIILIISYYQLTAMLKAAHEESKQSMETNHRVEDSIVIKQEVRGSNLEQDSTSFRVEP